MASNLPAGVALTELPLSVGAAMIGLPLDEGVILTPAQRKALEDFFALAHPLMRRERPVTTESWQAVSAGYAGLVELELQDYCPVRQAAASLALEQSAMDAAALASATSCWGCH